MHQFLLIPLAGAAATALFGRSARSGFWIALLTSLGMLWAAGMYALLWGWNIDGKPELETLEWLPGLGVHFAFQLDGISLVLIALTAFLAPLTALGAKSAITERHGQFWFWFHILHAAMLGALLARDLFFFFVCWELMLVPMYLMIAVWGGKNRRYAATKFFLYTALASLPMLAAIIWLGLKTRELPGAGGAISFLLEDVARLSLSPTEQLWCFAAFALAFVVKVPLWPLHTWLPDAHTEAPTPGSVILAGVLLKMGGYGLVRFAIPLFPLAAREAAPLLMTLGTIAIIAGSLCALVQTDIKRLVAYSSVAHMGAVVLGLFSLNVEGASGAVFQMLAHGVSTGALFLLVGFLYERRHTREFSAFGGLAKPMPIFAVCFVVTAMSSIALPGTNGFAGELLILMGAFKASPTLAAIAVLGAILGAWYMLGAVKKTFFGPVSVSENSSLADLSAREVLIMLPLVVAMFWMGLGADGIIDHFEGPLSKALAAAAGALK
jgi:NADH-quinone oxidoreductase subunit M